MDAMTMKMDAQYKELQSRPKQSTPDQNDEDIPMSREEEVKFMQTFLMMKMKNLYLQLPKPIKETPIPKPYKPKIPYPQRLRKEKMEAQYGKFLDIICVVQINVPLVDVLAGMPNYGKFLKDLISNKHKIEQISTAFLIDESSTMIQNKVPPKLRDPGSFLIPCNFNKAFSCNALANLGASINLMPYSFPWVSPIHCVPKKGGITVFTNENDKLVPTRTVTGWRVCIDYRKLNEATAKDHFPLPFMDQMLERLVGNKYFCFLDGFSGYFQIPIDPMDQEKTTFTCPFRTYAYRRMPFRLCNARATFQRWMLAIFHGMIEESVEVFMDDFSILGNSFDKYLNNLDKMLQRCKDAHLVLNWEKCHFMVKEGIVLGHKVCGAGLDVDKAKINVILKPPPIPISKVLEASLDTLVFTDDS
ncbi:reverse transcriptase domain-containing protein [Tanacetum coccineum]